MSRFQLHIFITLSHFQHLILFFSYHHHQTHTTMVHHGNALLLLVLCAFTYVSAHNQLLAPWGRSCFFEDVKKGDQLAVTFQVGNRDPHSSDQLEVNFWVSSFPKQFANMVLTRARSRILMEISEAKSSASQTEMSVSKSYQLVAMSTVSPTNSLRPAPRT